MKKLLFLLCFLSTSAFAIDKPIPCTGNSCKLLFETRDGSNVKVSAGEVSGSVWTFNGGLKPSAASSTLTSYANGSWTPERSFTGSNGSSSVSQQTGKYARLGNMVFITAYFVVSKGTATGALRITGLPFTVGSSYSAFTLVTDEGITVPANRSMPQMYAASTTTTLTPVFPSKTGSSTVAVDATDMGATVGLMISGLYYTE